ncbi:hypothetical protein MN608_03799 [Microdochium nivale]|nr:hypothetical protein MN608_03799 [Microdochium nivale]
MALRGRSPMLNLPSTQRPRPPKCCGASPVLRHGLGASSPALSSNDVDVAQSKPVVPSHFPALKLLSPAHPTPSWHAAFSDSLSPSSLPVSALNTTALTPAVSPLHIPSQLIMSRSRVPAIVGLTAVSGIGYYMYSAGGNPKVARKEAEADAHRASAKIKSELPGRTGEYRKEAEAAGARAGAAIDNYSNKAQTELQRATANAEAYAKDAKATTLKKVDEFDAKVEQKAAEAKSWFGFGGK